MASPHTRTTPVDLVVVTADPERLRRWLSPATVRALAIATPEPGSSLLDLPVDLAGTADIGGSGWDCVRVPLDGPVSALLCALRGLRRHLGPAAERTCAVVVSTPPPSPRVLVEIARAGLTPAIELVPRAWVLEPEVCPSPQGEVTPLPYDVRVRAEGRALAQVLVALGALPDGGPSSKWIEAVGDGTVIGSPNDWSMALAALHLEVAVAALVAARRDRLV